MGEPSEKCGDLNFALEYDYTTQTLKLRIIQVARQYSIMSYQNEDFWVQMEEKKQETETTIDYMRQNSRRLFTGHIQFELVLDSKVKLQVIELGFMNEPPRVNKYM